jgi:ABC-type transport system involved in Fe-S cluster assembly fused permease/ATPase subunit
MPCHSQHFNNESHEIAKFDTTLKSYEAASVKISTSLAFLNSGQNFIFSSALTMMMFLAAQGIVKGAPSTFHYGIDSHQIKLTVSGISQAR